MMTNEEKTTLIEAANALKGGMFVHIHGYVNESGEKSHVTFHAGANYERVHENSLKKLNEIVGDDAFKIEVCWNFWQDPDGSRHIKNKQESRTFVTNYKETIGVNDPDFQQAVVELRKSLTNPRVQNTNGIHKLATSVIENTNTNKIYFKNVLVHSKEIVEQGFYEPKASKRVTIIKNALQKMLPIGKYRSYIIDVDGVAQLPDGTQVPKYEYVSIFHETISSSSSSESDD